MNFSLIIKSDQCYSDSNLLFFHICAFLILVTLLTYSLYTNSLKKLRIGIMLYLGAIFVSIIQYNTFIDIISVFIMKGILFFLVPILDDLMQHKPIRLRNALLACIIRLSGFYFFLIIRKYGGCYAFLVVPNDILLDVWRSSLGPRLPPYGNAEPYVGSLPSIFSPDVVRIPAPNDTLEIIRNNHNINIEPFYHRLGWSNIIVEQQREIFRHLSKEEKRILVTDTISRVQSYARGGNDLKYINVAIMKEACLQFPVINPGEVSIRDRAVTNWTYQSFGEIVTPNQFGVQASDPTGILWHNPGKSVILTRVCEVEKNLCDPRQ